MIRRSIAPRSTCSISRIAAALALSAALVLSMDTSVCAASAPIARIVRIDGAEGANGAVSVKYRGTDSFVSVWRHEKIGAGDTIATGRRRAELAFPGGHDPCPRAVGDARDHGYRPPARRGRRE